ncbi:hypothetical protein CB1_000921009 [Camelus ferus]|nr:hypothetical protein CB1_000921009 [Camelus ferus]
MRVKVGVNRFGCVGQLVTRGAFNSVRVDIVAVSDPFTDINYMVYMFQCNFAHTSSIVQPKAENGKLVINGRPFSKAVGKVIPELNGKLTSMALRASSPNVLIVPSRKSC